MRRLLQLALALVLLGSPLLGQNSHIAKTLLVFPFENVSTAPGIEWISEAFPEVLNQRMGSSELYAVPRDDRNHALDRLGIPTGLKLSRATMYSVGREMDADDLIFGSYNFDGQTFTASAQVFEMTHLHLSVAQTESGRLQDLLQVENALSWDLLRILNPQFTTPKEQFMSSSPEFRLDAFEAYLRGVTAADPTEGESFLKRAVQIAPDYDGAIFALGKIYYNQHDYSSANSWFKRVPRENKLGLESSYYLGLGEYYLGQFAAAQGDFEFVASRLPLTEVYNNLGVVASRRGLKTAVQFLRRAAQDDPENPDYHFNLGVALYRAGDREGCTAELKRTLALRGQDDEARDFLAKAEAAAPVSDNDLPLERIRVNYDENSFHQLSQEIDNVEEQRLAGTDPLTHENFHLKRGRDLLAQGFAIEAGHEFREAVRLEPTDASAHLLLAQAQMASGEESAARAEIEASLKLHPTAEAHVALGQLDLKQNQPKDAQTEAAAALALDPKDAEALALDANAAERLAATPAHYQ